MKAIILQRGGPVACTLGDAKTRYALPADTGRSRQFEVFPYVLRGGKAEAVAFSDQVVVKEDKLSATVRLEANGGTGQTVVANIDLNANTPADADKVFDSEKKADFSGTLASSKGPCP
jgi:hypothetical protein